MIGYNYFVGVDDDGYSSISDLHVFPPLPPPPHVAQDIQLRQNMAYVTSADIQMESNDCYSRTPSIDPDNVGTTVEGEDNCDDRYGKECLVPYSHVTLLLDVVY